MIKIYSSKHYSSNNAEFGLLGKNLAKGGGVRAGAAMGMKKLRLGKNLVKRQRKKLLTNQGTAGKVARYGYKKMGAAKTLGSNLGQSALSKGRSGINKIKQWKQPKV